MKTNFLKRFVAATVAIVMVLLMVPVSPIVANAATTTYVFDATALTPGAEDKEVVVNSELDSYFTVSGTVQKRNGGNGVKSVEIAKNETGSINFTVAGTADVTINASSTGSSNASDIALVDASGNVIANNQGLSSVETTSATTITYTGLAAGSYKVVEAADGANSRGVRIFDITVVDTGSSSDDGTTDETTEAPEETTVPNAPVVSSTFVLEASALAAVAGGDKADGEAEACGTDNYFTLYYGSKTKIDSSNKTFSDGYKSGQRINMQGKSSIGDTISYAIGFTTTGAAAVKVWWVSGGDGREVSVLDSTGAVVDQTVAADSVKNSLYISELSVSEAGTYYVGSTEGSNYIFKVEVAVFGEETEDPSDPTDPVVDPSDPVVDPSDPVVDPSDPVEKPDVDPSKIDVWDFGAEQLDSSIYNNMLSVDEINSWYPDIEPGTEGTPLLSFTSSDGQLMFNANGKTNNRLRTVNTALSRYDAKSLTDADGNVYNGYIYSNSSSTDAVYVGLQVNAGDIITVVVGSNGGDSLINFAGPNGVEDAQTYVASGAKAQIMKFYPAETGMYKFFSSNEKLVLARIYRERTDKVSVSGSVTAPAELTDYSIQFTNQSNGVSVVAPVSGGAYSAELNEGFTYDVALVNANGYIISSEKTLTVAKDAASASLDVTVEKVALVTVTGNITGLDEAALAAMTLTFEADTVYIPEVTVSGSTYSVQLEVGVTYNVVVSGVDDYALTSAASVSYTEDAVADVALALKDTYAITIAPTGATLADLANATFTFTKLDEEGAVYTFTGPDNITLRDGTYSVKVSNSGIYVQQLTSNLKVNGAAVTKTIPFSSDITVWDFRLDDFTGQSPYNGLVISGSFGKHGAQYGMNIKNATIEVPVPGSCEIKVSVGYNWDISFEDGSSYFDNTNSGDIDVSYTYTGSAGTAVITVGGQCTSYIKQIEIIETVPFKDTLTVGASGCDYTSINDALAAVRAMERPNNERVTIEIQPGNYEEMLVIDVANVTLKNASSNPSIELTNKGVDIAANAVRITHYYGCGYNYYSMNSNCKYDETILAVNKENGYTDFVNPGDGTTNDSYWNATVIVKANGFQAEGIIFENSFNQYVSEKAANDVIVPNGECKEGSVTRGSLPVGSTAVQDKAYVERAAALAIANNVSQVYFDNCKFVGRQDTLYGGTGVTAAFYGCSIYGGTDYIFGGMTAVFAKCDLVFNTSENNNDVGYITAAQTPSGSHGLLMYNCNITSTVPGVDTASEFTSKPGYYGRPWAANTGEAVFYMTVIDAADANWNSIGASLIRAEGWQNTLSGSSALCGEYGTYEYAEGVDNSANRAAWATVFAEEKLASGEPIAIETWLGDWDAFAGKDMTVEIPTVEEPNYVAEANGVGYETLEEAIAAGGEVKLLADYEIAKAIKISNDVTVDLNGFKVTGPDDGKANWYAFIVDGGDLTLKDSVGTGELYAKCYGVETKSGSFTMESGKITATKNKTVGTAIVNYGGTVAIEGGTVEGVSYAVYTCGYFADASTSITGGTITGDVAGPDTLDNGTGTFAEEVTSTVNTYAAAEGYKWVEENGVYVLTAISYVAEVNGVQYETLAEAIAAAEAGATVTLLSDVALEAYVTVSKELTLDLNGKTISGDFDSDYGMVYVGMKGNLTVTDSVGTGAMTVASGYAVGNYGVLTVKGGTYTTGDDTGTDAALYNFYHNGTIYGTATIEGGTFNSIIWNCGVLAVNGGVLENGVDNSGNLAITDGTVNGSIIARDGSDAPALENNGTIAISGGIYENAVDEAWCAEGFVPAENEDGTFGVTEYVPVTVVTVTYVENGKTVSSVEYSEGEVIVLADLSGNVPAGYTFAGWVTETVTDSAEAPTVIYLAGSEYTVDADVTFHALYTAGAAGGNGFELYSGAITEGDYIIVYNNLALNTTVTSNRMQVTEIEISNDVVVDPDADIIWHIAPNGDYWTLYNETDAVYAASTNSNNQSTTSKTVTNNAKWSVTGDSAYEFINYVKNSRYFRYNAGYGFGCYASSTGGALSLYKKAEASISYTTSVVTYEVSFNVPEGVDAVETMESGKSGIVLPEAGVPTGEYAYQFVGWAAETVDNSDVAPTLYAAGDTYVAEADTELYAVYTYVVEDGGASAYKLVTDSSQLVIGSKVVIAAAGYDVAMSTTQNNNNRGQAAITKDGDTISFTSGVAELILGAGAVDGTYSFYSDTGSIGYLYAASTSSNHLKTKAALEADGSFAITVNGDGTSDVVAQREGRNTMRYNSSNSLFACYGSGQNALSLYIETASGTTYYTTLSAKEEPAPELFDIAGANLELANDITMYFYVNAADYADGYYMEIVKSGKEDAPVIVSEWGEYMGMYRVGFNGIAAKEMTDDISVTVYNADGVAVSNTTVATVSQYALNVLNSSEPVYVATHTLMADLLNYGAAAQTFFGYNTDKLANAEMTDAHRACATQDFNIGDYTTDTVIGTGAVGANLGLETNIIQYFYFDPAVVNNTMTAKISYTNCKGVAKTAEISGDKFGVMAGYGYIIVDVAVLVPADVMSPVTVEIVNAEGVVVASVSESIASAAVRANTNSPDALYEELMKYALSCEAYFG